MGKFIRVKDFMSRTGLPKWAVYKYISDGTIKGTQLEGKGTAIWIVESEVERFAALLRGK